MWKRVGVIVLGGWLTCSSFAWPHTVAQARNTLVVGILLVVLGVLSTIYSWVRFGTVVLAAWLFVSVIALGRMTTATYWNNVMVAFLVFVLSMLEPNRVFWSRGKRGMAGGGAV
jgi:O-antigen ligase